MRTSAGIGFDPVRLERGDVALLSVARRGEAEVRVLRVADEADAAVPELEQVPHRELAAGHVVDHEPGEPRMARVDEHRP